MPYFLRKRGDEHCVIKGTKDNPGETVKCHPTHDKALAHLRALYVHVEDVQKELGAGQGVGGSRQGVGGVSQCVCPKCGEIIEHERDTPCMDHVCPECGAKMMPMASTTKAQPDASVGSIIESRIHRSFTVAADVLYGLGYMTRDERIKLSGAVGDSLDSMTHVLDKLDMGKRSVDGNTSELLMNFLGSGRVLPPPQQSISALIPYKDALTDIDRWIAVSTAAVWDISKELFTERAMDYDIARALRTKQYPELRMYHVRGFNVGQCDSMSRVGKWAVDRGYWDSTRFAQAVKDEVRRNIGRWKISRGFFVVKATGLCPECGVDLMVGPWNFLFGVKCKSCNILIPKAVRLKQLQYLQTVTYDISITDVPIVPVTAVAAYSIGSV